MSMPDKNPYASTQVPVEDLEVQNVRRYDQRRTHPVTRLIAAFLGTLILAIAIWVFCTSPLDLRPVVTLIVAIVIGGQLLYIAVVGKIFFKKTY